ncbi:MAG: type II CAAX endopeptidase family protein [Anaeromyxobacteraceae bacterium]
MDGPEPETPAPPGPTETPGATASPPAPAPSPAAPPAGPPRKSASLFFLTVFLLMPLAGLAQGSSMLGGLLWSELFVFLVPALVATAGSGLRLRAYLGLGRTEPALLVLGGLAGAAGTLLAVVLQAGVVRVVPPAWLESFDVAQHFRGPAWERWAIAATASIAAPLCEEVAFRGYLLRTLRLRRGPGAAIAISAALFAVTHLNPVLLVGLVGLGVLFGWLAVRGGSLWPAVAAHAGNNAVVSWALVHADEAGARDVAAAPPQAGPLLATLVLGLAVLVPVLVAFARAAATLPPPQDPLAPRDPASPPGPFRLARVPLALRLAVPAGALALAALALLRR